MGYEPTFMGGVETRRGEVVVRGRAGLHPRPHASLHCGRPPAPAPEHLCPGSPSLHPHQLINPSGPTWDSQCVGGQAGSLLEHPN